MFSDVEYSKNARFMWNGDKKLRKLYMWTSGFDETIKNAVDYDMMLKLAEVGEVKHIDKVLYQCRRHHEMMTTQHSETQTIKHFIVINNSIQKIAIRGVKVVPDRSFQDEKAVLFLGE